jgi:hypothetical protein
MFSMDFTPPNPPVSDQIVREVEALLGVTLPPSYIALMREHNGGYIEERLVPVEADPPKGLRGHMADGYVIVGSIAGLNSDPDAYGGISFTTKYQARIWNLPEGLVPLGGDGHTFVALDYRQRPQNPPVIFITSDTGSYVTIARDFAEFLHKMIPSEQVYDEQGNLRSGR